MHCFRGGDRYGPECCIFKYEYTLLDLNKSNTGGMINLLARDIFLE